jgi:hypothetical protein
MKKLLSIMLVLGILSSAAFADTTSFGTAKVLTTVGPTIAVAGGAVQVSATAQQGNPSTQRITAKVTFAVTANQQYLVFNVNATDLWKAGQQDTVAGNLIPLDGGTAALVQPSSGNPYQGGTNSQAWVGGATPTVLPAGQSLYGMNTYATVPSEFESTQTGQFVQPVDVTVVWDMAKLAPGKLLPTGDYWGYVKLIGTTNLL